jgi:hypothetical protein
MPRTARVAPGGQVYHVLNRSVGRMHLFRKEADYAAFERVMVEAHDRQPVRILSYREADTQYPKLGRHGARLRWHVQASGGSSELAGTRSTALLAALVSGQGRRSTGLSLSARPDAEPQWLQGARSHSSRALPIEVAAELSQRDGAARVLLECTEPARQATASAADAIRAWLRFARVRAVLRTGCGALSGRLGQSPSAPHKSRLLRCFTGVACVSGFPRRPEGGCLATLADTRHAPR